MDEQEQYGERSKVFGLILGGGLIGLGAVIVATAFAKKPCGCNDEEVNDEAPHLAHPDEDAEPLAEPEKWPDPVTVAEEIVAGD